jgi:phospholipid/cholesterol/gamma-HCH transport system substrate-binding protein
MEIRARYTLIGTFTLAVIAAAFLFVYWLNGSGTLRYGSRYQIRFENTVSGLLTGSAVLFNGVRVGEVTALKLSPEQPRQILAVIAVNSGVPVRDDTKASIEFQGLMGSPAVSLTGGTSQSPPSPGPGGLPTLVADPGAGQNVTAAVREVLGHVDTVVTDNAAPLRSLITNLAAFADALGRNSTHVDGIIAGLERLTGGGAKATPTVYELSAAHTFPAFDKPANAQLTVREPTALDVLSSDRIVARGERGLSVMTDEAKWSDLLPLVLQAGILRSFENAGLLRQSSRPLDGLNSDFQLVTELHKFDLVTGANPMAEIEFAARLLSADGKVIAAKVFHAEAPAKGTDAAAAAAALDAAFNGLAVELVLWTSNAMRGGSQG